MCTFLTKLFRKPSWHRKVVYRLHNLLSHWDCGNVIDVRLCKGEEYVIGPEKEPYSGWCKQTVQTTASALSDLITFVLRVEVQLILRKLIDGLAVEGLKCCAKGGVWKSCVGPLAKKLHIWNQKWKCFGIPPDPAWD